MIRGKIHRSLVAAVAGVGLLGSPAMAALKKVTLLQPVPAIDIRNAPWAVAQEMGWLADAGIDLDIQFAKGSVIVIQQIMSGSAQYGMPPPEPALNSAVPATRKRSGPNRLVTIFAASSSRLTQGAASRLSCDSSSTVME